MTDTPAVIAPAIRLCLTVLDGSQFDADEFPGLDDAKRARVELEALIAALQAARPSVAWAKTVPAPEPIVRNIDRILAQIDAALADPVPSS